MRPTVPTLAIRFDIDALEKKHPDVCYGEAAWSIVVGAVDLSSIQGESSLFEGDSLNNEYVFCIVFQNANRSPLDYVQASIEASPAFREVADSQPVLSDEHRGRIVGLPLVHNADIHNGDIDILVSTFLRSALAKRRQAKREPVAAAYEGAVPQRPRPASKRTASLPSFSSRDDLVALLEKSFGVPGVYGAYVTPEELCDIVEKYQDSTRAFLCQDHDHGNEMQVHLLARTDVAQLFGGDSQKPQSTDRGIRFGGLTEFASHADALNYCNKSVSTRGGVDSAWNIQGKYALNFMIESMFTEQIDPSRPVTADELWAEICMRRANLKIPKSKQSGCFIATVCYGTDDCPQLAELRRFRDEVLLRSALGRTFVALYYSVSPMIAQWLKSRPHAAALVRRGVLDRLVSRLRRTGRGMPNKTDAGDGR